MIPANERTKAILENNSALRVLAELDNGRTASELDYELAQLVQAATITGKKGKVTVEVTVEPNGEGKVEIDADVKPKVPKPTKHTTTFFVGDSGHLSRSDPRQRELNFQSAKAAAPAAVAAN